MLPFNSYSAACSAIVSRIRISRCLIPGRLSVTGWEDYSFRFHNQDGDNCGSFRQTTCFLDTKEVAQRATNRVFSN